MTDPYNLQRFVDAQDPVFEQVRLELRAGEKRSHWMWFIFPQIEGLGRSAMAREFAIATRQEALAYSSHPLLGARLAECARLVNAIEGRSIAQIFGPTDAMKFRSSMTLFAHASADREVFDQALKKYFDGQPDAATLERLGERGG